MGRYKPRKKDGLTDKIENEERGVELATVIFVFHELRWSSGGDFDRRFELLGAEVEMSVLFTFSVL